MIKTNTKSKKKILFLVNNPYNFKGFFQKEIYILSKYYDLNFLVYKSGFDNLKIKEYQSYWFRLLKKNKIVKKIWWLDQTSYTNIFENLKFNRNFVKIINQIKSSNIDFFLCPNKFHYWEDIFCEYFKNKNIYCYLINPSTGLDLFNSLKEFKKSLKKGKIENKEKFNVISDSLAMHNFNTKTVKKKKFISFFLRN